MARVLGRPLDTRTVALSVAGLLAAGTGLLTFNYLAAIGHRVATSAQRQVIVAAKTIPAHATITAAMLVAAKRPADAVDPDAVVAPGGAIGLSAVNEIPVGSTITASKLAHALANGLPGRVRPGMRAVSIALDRVKGVSNLLQAGDRVDVIAVTTPRTDGTPKAAAIIRGARILSIGQQIDTPTSANASPSPDQATTATLEVTPQQADLLTLADVDATLRLALRSPRDNARNEKAETISFSAPPPPRPAIAAPAKPAVAAPVAQRTPQPKPTSPVLVIDGGTAYHPTL